MSENEVVIFPAMLKKIIEKDKVKTLSEFARKIEVALSTVHDWVTGESKPEFDHPGIRRLLKYTDMTYEQLFYGRDLRREEYERRLAMARDIYAQVERAAAQGRALQGQMDIEEYIEKQGAA